MGGFPTSAKNSNGNNVGHDSPQGFVDYVQEQQEAEILRKKLLKTIILKMPCPVIIVILGPPVYDAAVISEFIANKLGVKSSGMKFNIGMDETSSQDTIFERLFLEQMQDPTNSNGFVIYNIPSKLPFVRIIENNKNNFTPIFFFLKCNNQTLFLATRHRWDKYVHLPSGREYHLCSTPPLSHLKDNSLLDDITGEPLVQLEEDTVVWYKKQLTKYHEDEFLIQFHFPDKIHSIDCADSKEIIEFNVIKLLDYVIIALTNGRTTTNEKNLQMRFMSRKSTLAVGHI